MKIPDNAEYIWQYLYPLIQNPYGVAAVLGNLYAESGLTPANLQNSYVKQLGMTDAEYTAAVDKGTYQNFANDQAGYGLAQWTYHSRKQNLLAAAKTTGKSIGDLDCQLYFLCMELHNYSTVLEILCQADSIQLASDAFMLLYEKPANKTKENKRRRAELSQVFYDQFVNQTFDADEFVYEPYQTMQKGMKGKAVQQLQNNLLSLGFDIGPDGADGQFGKRTRQAVIAFQQSVGLYADGKAGALTQDLLLYVLMQRHDSSTKYTVTISHLDEQDAQYLFSVYEKYPVLMEAE